MPIQSFSDKQTETFFKTGKFGKKTKWQHLARAVQRKLDMVHYAAHLSDLKSPPNNQLEALKKDLKGFYSIRINDQWRVIFQWTNQGPTNVAVVDYDD